MIKYFVLNKFKRKLFGFPPKRDITLTCYDEFDIAIKSFPRKNNCQSIGCEMEDILVYGPDSVYELKEVTKHFLIKNNSIEGVGVMWMGNPFNLMWETIFRKDS